MKIAFVFSFILVSIGHAQLVLSDRAKFVLPQYETAINPGFIRAQTVSLNGAWRFGLGDGDTNYQRGQIRQEPLDMLINVPYAPQSKKSGLALANLKSEVLWYDRDVVLPSDWKGGLLHFAGVDHEAEIYFNGKFVGFHKGGYDPFAIDVSKYLKLGSGTSRGIRHQISLRVRDSRSDRSQVVGKQERVEKEGVIFYGNSSGIWKDVYIERINEAYIKDFRVHATAKGEFQISAEVSGESEGRLRVRFTHQEDSSAVLVRNYDFKNGVLNVSDSLSDPKLWSIENPNLYYIDIELLDRQGEVIEKAKSYTGFRTFEQKNGYYHLNGKPFQLRGLLNQAVFPDTLYTTEEEKTLRDFSYTLEAGFNGERRHQTTPSKRDQWHADRMGLWMAIELPSARDLIHAGSRTEALRQWQKIVLAYAYNPSVIFLVPGNEDWGFLRDKDHWTRSSAKDREKFQMEAYRATIEVAPANMVFATGDGWRSISSLKNGKSVPEIDSSRLMNNFHEYASGALLVKNYARLPVFTLPGTPLPRNMKDPFHENGYGYNGHTPIVLSEIGGRASTDNPEQIKNIFAYGKVHTDAQTWGRSIGNNILALKYAKVVRGGYVVTQTRDAGNDPSDPKSGGELNGILKADGTQKLPAAYFKKINTEVENSWRAEIHEYRRLAEEFKTPEGRRRIEEAHAEALSELRTKVEANLKKRPTPLQTARANEEKALAEEKRLGEFLKNRQALRAENLRKYQDEKQLRPLCRKALN